MSDQAPRVSVQMRIERLYVKDVSFESPAAPAVFAEPFRPEFQIDINTAVNGLGEGRHEVVLSITATARKDSDKVAYLIEVQQAGVFFVEGAEAGALQQVLGIACPSTLFPYARETLDSLAVKGGFPPLQLAPVNFEALYAQAMQKRAAQSNTSPDPDVTH
jgi:preprotein translocase subunit SecB